MDRDAKESTMTPLSDLPLRVKGQKRSKCSTISNGKNNSVNVLIMDRQAKVSTVTPLCDLLVIGQRSIKVTISFVTQESRYRGQKSNFKESGQKGQKVKKVINVGKVKRLEMSERSGSHIIIFFIGVLFRSL